MAKKKERPAPHPDDFMIVAVSLAFQAKLNPEVDDPLPLDAIGNEETFAAADAADYLEKVVSAIRERRLYGFMLQEHAESAVGARDRADLPTHQLSNHVPISRFAIGVVVQLAPRNHPPQPIGTAVRHLLIKR